MRILVVSDSHGDAYALRDAIRREGNFSLMIHLGDGERDTATLSEALSSRPLLQVRGNCDFGSPLPDTLLTTEGGKTILCTHGYTQRVKYGTGLLYKEALEQKADIALYGHTHVPVHTYEDGVYLCNPGSIRNGDYAVLEIVPSGIMWLPKRLF